MTEESISSTAPWPSSKETGQGQSNPINKGKAGKNADSVETGAESAEVLSAQTQQGIQPPTPPVKEVLTNEEIAPTPNRQAKPTQSNQEIAIGDYVRYRSITVAVEGEIVDIDGQIGFVRDANGQTFGYSLRDLIRCDRPRPFSC